MQKRLFLFVAFLSILFTNCNNEKTASTNVSTMTPLVSASPKGFYKHLKGTIDSFPITMDLVQLSPKNDETTIPFTGHYYYDKYQQPIGFYGEIDSMGNIVLYETNWNNEEINFKGKLDANGSFSGTWQNLSTKKDRTFALKETNADGALAFDFHVFEDSLKLWKNSATSPVASFDMELLLPSKNTEGGLAAFLKDKIFMGINNDSIEKSYAALSVEALKNAVRDTFFKNYLEEMKDEKPDSVGFTANYAESSSVSVLFNERGLLSLAYGAYSYGGGAHGNHATGIATYDLTQKKALKLTDVFLPNFEKPIAAALTNAVRKQFNMKPKEPLSSHLFDNKIEHTTNFCITKKGITFLYNLYEIAAYAMGEIELFIPFEEVKSIVNPRFLQ